MKKIHYFTILLIIFAVGCNSNKSTNFGKEVKAEQIIELLNNGKNILLVEKTIIGDLDFTKIDNKYARTQNIIIANIENSVSFIKCKFEGNIIAFNVDDSKKGFFSIFEKNLTFSECIFKGEVNFRQTEIKGLSNFSKSTFEKKASFEGVVFNSLNTFFNDVFFEDEAKFTSSSFMGKTTFMNTNFSKKTGFNNAFFMKNVNFSSTNFKGYTNFYSIHSNSDFIINYANFHNEIIFGNSRFFGRTEFIKTFSKEKITIKDNIFYFDTKFNESTFKNKADIRNNTFIASKPELNDFTVETTTDFEFENCYYPINKQLTMSDTIKMKNNGN